MMMEFELKELENELRSKHVECSFLINLNMTQQLTTMPDEFYSLFHDKPVNDISMQFFLWGYELHNSHRKQLVQVIKESMDEKDYFELNKLISKIIKELNIVGWIGMFCVLGMVNKGKVHWNTCEHRIIHAESYEHLLVRAKRFVTKYYSDHP